MRNVMCCCDRCLSILKNGKAKAVRFSTLNSICEVLDCQPGDILGFSPE
ncbi:helix-turn-helix domain-containing protein [Arenibacter echinorum]|nr:helix-turn-helix domain-containing protein [Arenibacter echinorum]